MIGCATPALPYQFYRMDDSRGNMREGVGFDPDLAKQGFVSGILETNVFSAG